MDPQKRSYAYDKLISIMRDFSAISLPQSAHECAREINRLAKNALNAMHLGKNPLNDVHAMYKYINYVQSIVKDVRLRNTLDIMQNKVVALMSVLKKV